LLLYFGYYLNYNKYTFIIIIINYFLILLNVYTQINLTILTELLKSFNFWVIIFECINIGFIICIVYNDKYIILYAFAPYFGLSLVILSDCLPPSFRKNKLAILLSIIFVGLTFVFSFFKLSPTFKIIKIQQLLFIPSVDIIQVYSNSIMTILMFLCKHCYNIMKNNNNTLLIHKFWYVIKE
jgi:hypothetical protein